ncbi:MAG: aryl-sulfate sulfotransferase [Thermodesulfobacteriota bacterium]
MRYSINSKAVLRNLLLLLFIGFFSISGCNNNSTNEDNVVNVVTKFPTLIMAPNASTPLAGLLELQTSGLSRVSLTVSDGSDQWSKDFEEFNSAHSLAVLGFKPDRAHTVTVRVLDIDGIDLIEPVVFNVTTEALPQGFPEISVTSIPELMEPGVTLFEAAGYLIAVNEIGEVVWYHRIQFFSAFLDRDVRRINNGNLLLLLPRDKIVELDMLGNIVNLWHSSGSSDGEQGSIPVDTLAFHHEVFEMPSGNFLALSVEFRRFFDYTTSVTNPFAPLGTEILAGDVIVEFAPDGTIINQWALFDMLDPYRINYSSLLGLYDGLFESIFGTALETRDWSHGNAVVHDPSDDSIIVSLRHQDAVIKFSRQTGKLIWILGPHENWDTERFGQFLLTPKSDEEFFFQYHQHAPDITDKGTYIIYDNGNNRASPFDPTLPDSDNFSRAVEYKIDEFTKEVEIVWEYGQFEDETLYTFFIGDADYQPQTGNVLITFGGRQPARLIEVTRTTPAQKVFDLTLFENFAYRSERLPSLYP